MLTEDTTPRELPYWLNDLYHAVRIKHLHGDDIRYCGKLGGFLIWHATHWAPDEDFTMWRWATEATDDIWLEAEKIPDEYAARCLYTQKWTKRAERRRHIEDAFTHLRALEGITVAPDAFDSDPWLLNVQNGAIDLRTGKLREHRREDMITRLSPTVYTPNCPPPQRWLQFLSEIFHGNKDIIDFVQRACGYALTGSVSEEKFFFLHGSGGNGTTTFLNTLMHVMGNYSRRLPPNLLSTFRRGLRPYIFAELKGCRFACIAEVESGGKLGEAMVKQLTGSDRLIARHTRADYIEFEPTHTLFIRGNHLPEIRGTGHGLWRRILLIPFTAAIPEEKQDRDLPNKLRAEASGILTWLVTGCLEWQRRGLAPAAEVVDATAVFKSDMDVLGEFLDECCLLDPDGGITNPEMRKAYEAWCQRNGEQPLSARGLTLRLKERGFVQKRVGHSRTRTWVGIALNPYEEEISDEELRQIEEILEKLEGYDREREKKEGVNCK